MVLAALKPALKPAGARQTAVGARRDPSFMVMARTDALALEGLSSAINRMEKYVEAVRLAAGSPCGTPAQRVQSLNRHAPGGRLRASRLHGAAASARTDGFMRPL